MSSMAERIQGDLYGSFAGSMDDYKEIAEARQKHRDELFDELVAAGLEIGDEFIYDYTADGERLYTNLADWLRARQEADHG